jgi:prepilin-type processing-associated H-X9-DG protein
MRPARREVIIGGAEMNLRRKQNVKAFTLLELLVVIAIIMILAAMLLPAISRSMVKAKQVQCLSQLRQVGLAMLSFAHDHQDRFPMQVPMNAGGSIEANREFFLANTNLSFSSRHFVALSNELANPRLAACPADTTRSAASTFATMTRSNISYWVNYRASSGSSIQALAGDWNVASVPGTTNLEMAFTRALHETRGNVLFADGHVELRKTLLLQIPNPVAAPRPPIGPPGNTLEPTAGGTLGKSGANRTGGGSMAGLSAATSITRTDPTTRAPSELTKAKTTDAEPKPDAVPSQFGPNNRKTNGPVLAAHVVPPEYSRINFGSVGNSDTNSAPFASSPVPAARRSKGAEEDEIPLLASIREAASWLLWLLLIVALAFLLHRYLSRRKPKRSASEESPPG